MSKSLPAILPEDVVPPACRFCKQCEVGHHGTRVIWGEGNPAAPLFVILDNPGAREDKEGVPYLCGTRETMQTAAYEAGVEPGSMYISYLLKCRPRRAYDKEKARATCLNYLWGQLEAADPKVIMCLGNVVCQALFGEADISVKELRGKVHLLKNYRIVTSYHPLAVRRRPVLYKYFLQDWRLVVEQLALFQ
ncbi:MAG: uracil-DNA glycosylase [Dethiobacteria bacterium]